MGCMFKLGLMQYLEKLTFDNLVKLLLAISAPRPGGLPGVDSLGLSDIRIKYNRKVPRSPSPGLGGAEGPGIHLFRPLLQYPHLSPIPVLSGTDDSFLWIPFQCELQSVEVQHRSGRDTQELLL